MTSEAIQTIQQALGPYIKPREQTAYIRRVLALHLLSHLGSSTADTTRLPRPLALADGPASSDSYRDVLPGLQRDYLKALAANAGARAQYDQVRRELSPPITSEDDDYQELRRREEKEAAAVDFLHLHVAIVEMRRKKARLEILQKHIDALSQMPAASTTFLDADEVFSACAPLPSVPREVMESFALDPGASGDDLKVLAGRLERVALRAKLQLEKEENLLQEARERTAGVAERAGPAAKLHALNATRAELIAWIEAELSKTTENQEGSNEANEGSIRKIHEQDEIKARVAEQLSAIKNAYANYVAARKALIEATTVRPEVPAIITKQPTPPLGTTTASPSSSIRLVLPYVEALLAVAGEHKGTIAHKAHINASLSKQMRDSCQTLDHLASESQLLGSLSASRGPFGPGKPRTLTTGLLGQDKDARPSLTSQAKSWVTAADGAKLATLEAVAEKIEEGEVALKGSLEALEELNLLLGRDVADASKKQDDDAGAEDQEEDVWLAAGGARGSRIPSKRAAAAASSKKKEVPTQNQKRDVWSLLDGQIGVGSSMS